MRLGPFLRGRRACIGATGLLGGNASAMAFATQQRVWMRGLLLQRFFNGRHRPDTFRAIGQRRHHATGSPQDIEHDTGSFG